MPEPDTESLLSPLIRKMERIFNLTADEKRVLEGACTTTREFGAHEDIIKIGDRPWQSNLLLEGMVYRYKRLSGGKRQILSFQYPGDIFDSYSFVLEVMDHSIATFCPSKIAYIPHETMLEITERHPRIARALWKDTLIDASVFAEWMTNIRGKLPHAQVAHLICEVVVRFAVVDLAENDEVNWPITSSEMEDALGISAHYIETVLAEFQHNGWITLFGGRLTVHRLDKLKELAEFDPIYLHLNHPLGAASRRIALDWVKPL